jgi:hypothetical protein
VARAVLLICALALALTGCGGDDGGGGGPRPGVFATLDPDNLALVHDELYVCLRGELPGSLLASSLGGQASISDSYGRSDFDARLAAPEAESELLDAGRAEFIGVRANTRRPSFRDQPEWDILIFSASADAEQGAAAIAKRRGRADQDGIFVRVTKRAGRGDRARTAEAALTRCLDLSRRP